MKRLHHFKIAHQGDEPWRSGVSAERRKSWKQQMAALCRDAATNVWLRERHHVEQSAHWNHELAAEVGRVTPCAPLLVAPGRGARGATRPTVRFMGGMAGRRWVWRAGCLPWLSKLRSGCRAAVLAGSLGLGLLSGAVEITPAQEAKSASQLEYQVKAAFMPKLAAFVRWPERALADRNAPIVLGILGNDPFGPEFDLALKTQKANGRSFVVKRFHDVAQAEKCQMLFVSSSDKERLRQIFAALKAGPVLTIGDTESFAESGGMINFVKEEGKLRFQINLDAVERAGLSISAKLLQVSRVFQGGQWRK